MWVKHPIFTEASKLPFVDNEALFDIFGLLLKSIKMLSLSFKSYLHDFGFLYPSILYNINSKANKDGTQSDEIIIGLKFNSQHISIEGMGNGPIDAMINAVKNHFNMDITISDYHQHAISSGSDAKAVAYSELSLNGKSMWGVGIHQNTVIAGLQSVISGLNRLSI